MLVGSPWVADGSQVAIKSSWDIHGVPMGFPWATHGVLVVYSHGPPMGYQWAVNRLPQSNMG